MTASLARSHAASDLPLWAEMYRKAFPDFAGMIDHRQDGEHQRAGIDRSIILANSKQILVDEKVRGKNKRTGAVYEDILLEYLSDQDRKVPGWVCKPLRADYIAYAIAPLGRGYLLPVVQLQSAWRENCDRWADKYGTCRAENSDGPRRWTTLSVPVPVAALFQQIGRMLRVSFAPTDYQEGDRHDKNEAA